MSHKYSFVKMCITIVLINGLLYHSKYLVEILLISKFGCVLLAFSARRCVGDKYGSDTDIVMSQ